MRHNDYPATLLMEPAANDEPSRYRMTPAASTVRRQNSEPTYTHAEFVRRYSALRFEAGNKPGPGGIVVPIASFDCYTEFYTQRSGSVQQPKSTESASGAALIGTKAEPEAEVWHTEVPTVAGVYLTRLLEPGGRTGPRWFDGTFYHALGGDGNDPRKCTCYGNNRDIQWLRLIKADTPAPAAQESEKPSVFRSSPLVWRIGSMAFVCDADGWISHTPTADAVCPVPAGVMCNIRYSAEDNHTFPPNGNPRLGKDWYGWGEIIHSWRPIQA